MELTSLICIKCYKQAAPLGLKERQTALQLQGGVHPKSVKFIVRVKNIKLQGISGSPIDNSNTDSAMKAALEATGVETGFISRVDCSITPCRACIGCVDTNRCVNVHAEKPLL